MGLETGSFIPDLVDTNPAGTDPKSEGDDHLRLIKTCTQGSFPAFIGTIAVPAFVSLTEDQINDAALQSRVNVFTANQDLENAVQVRGKTFAGTDSFALCQVNNSDIAVIGSNNINTQYRALDNHDIRINNQSQVTINDRSLGALLIRDIGGTDRKGGFRNPGVNTLSASQDAAQEDEGQYYRITGDPIVLTCVPLEQGTCIRIIVGGSVNNFTIDENGVTLRWLQGGDNQLGTRAVAKSSVVDLFWRTSTDVDMWGNGIS